MTLRTLLQLSLPAPHSPLALMRLPELMKVVQLSRSSIYARLDESSKYYDDSFPRPVTLSPSGRGGVAWVASEVEAWIERRIENRNQAIASTAITAKSVSEIHTTGIAAYFAEARPLGSSNFAGKLATESKTGACK